jgi:phosphate acetyltransferase
MEDVLGFLKNKAKAKYRKVVLPESTDERVLKAAHICIQEKLAQITLVGNKEKLTAVAQQHGYDLSGATFFDPLLENIEPLAQVYYNRRKHKGATLEEARALMKSDAVFAGAALVGAGVVDGMVCGCVTETAKVIKAALFCIGMKKGISLVSSYFMMVLPDATFGENGVLFYADCGVNPNPNAEQLADIAKCTADSLQQIIGKQARIGMLSFSTKGSAKHPDVDKVIQATAIAKQKYPELLIDGELQLDAAVIPAIGKRKAPGSTVAGNANVLIFPDLDAGNIGYKLTERFAKAYAFGPILQGLDKPVNDLSRGASAEDIVNVVAITELQMEK